MFRMSFRAAMPILLTTTLVYGATGNATRVPVLLELFTSEGCSDCPPADRLLETLYDSQPIAGADLIVLSEHVDYWNNSGWKDPFSSPQYTARQQEYDGRYKLAGGYTPQLVVDGRYAFVGSDRGEATAAIQKAIREPMLPISILNAVRGKKSVVARIELSAAPDFKGVRAMLYVALADKKVESQVRRGENAGRLLTHVAVTRILNQEGTIDLNAGATRQIKLAVPSSLDGNELRLVAFVQDPGTGHVLGAAEQKL